MHTFGYLCVNDMVSYDLSFYQKNSCKRFFCILKLVTWLYGCNGNSFDIAWNTQKYRYVAATMCYIKNTFLKINFLILIVSFL